MTSQVTKKLVGSLVSFCELFQDEVERGVLVILIRQKNGYGKKIEIYPLQEFFSTLS